MKNMLVVLGLGIEPELLEGNVGIPVVLTEVRKLLVDVAPDVTAIHGPDLNVAAHVILAQIGGGQRLCHRSPFRPLVRAFS